MIRNENRVFPMNKLNGNRKLSFERPEINNREGAKNSGGKSEGLISARPAR